MYYSDPPFFAIAIAIFDSVTVSMADEIKGILRFILSDKLTFILAFAGVIDENFGINKTSSNVRASLLFPYKLIYNFVNL